MGIKHDYKRVGNTAFDCRRKYMLVGVNCEMDFYWTNPVRVEEAARGFYTIWCCSSWSLPWDPSFASNLWDPLTKMQPWLLVCNGLVCVCWLEGFRMGLGKKSFLDTNQATTELCFFWDIGGMSLFWGYTNSIFASIVWLTCFLAL